MRNAFFNALEESARQDETIYVLTADLGFHLFDSFRSSFPDRFFDIGVAEPNMIGIAAGLSLSGKNVYCYSMVPFLIMRAYEQIRVDVAYHNLNVKLIGVGGGLAYGLEGYTHLGLEDIALVRSLPNFTIVVPADPMEAVCAAEFSSAFRGPLYIRLGKSGELPIHTKKPDFRVGKAMILGEGSEVGLFAVGNMVHVAQRVADMLHQRGVTATLVNMHTIRPLDTEMVTQVAGTHNLIVSLEEHNLHGGMGSAIAETLLEAGYRGSFKKCGIPENLIDHTGCADSLREKCGLFPERIYQSILDIMNGARL